MNANLIVVVEEAATNTVALSRVVAVVVVVVEPARSMTRIRARSQGTTGVTTPFKGKGSQEREGLDLLQGFQEQFLFCL